MEVYKWTDDLKTGNSKIDADHKKNHTYFVTELDKLANKIRQNPSNIVNMMELNQLISGWFFKHIKRLDVEVAHHIQK